MELYEKIAEAVKTGKSPIVGQTVQAMIDDGHSAEDILNNGLIKV